MLGNMHVLIKVCCPPAGAGCIKPATNNETVTWTFLTEALPALTHAIVLLSSCIVEVLPLEHMHFYASKIRFTLQLLERWHILRYLGTLSEIVFAAIRRMRATVST